MDRLGPIDHLFLDVERSGPALAVGAVSEASGEPPTVAELRELVAGRLPRMERFRQRVEPSRTKIRSAKWVTVAPELDHHVRARELAPGGNLDEAVSAIMDEPMDQNRPLWTVTLLTGYAADRWAFVIRLHHAIADGQGAFLLTGNLVDVTPDGSVTLADAAAATARDDERAVAPEEGNRMAAMADDLGARVSTAARSLVEAVARTPDTVLALVQSIPRRPSRLTGPVSGKRCWVSAHYPLSEVKRARRAYRNATVNDIVLAAVAAGFTELLRSRGEDPGGRVLRAVMPVSLRTDQRANNQVGILNAPLPLGDLEPAERMSRIRRSTGHSKNSMLPRITDDLTRVARRTTPSTVRYRLAENSGMATQFFAETLVTNVPGPQVQLYFLGRPIVSQAPMIPIEGTLRIIVGITSYAGQLNLGITGDGEHAADVDVLLRGAMAGLAEIVAKAPVVEPA